MTITTINIDQIILKRGNLAQSANYMGVMGEVTYDTTLRALRVHNGIVPGGNIVLDTGFIANIQEQINYIRENFDANAIDSITELSSAMGNFGNLVSTEANIRANVDANLQAQITSIIFGDRSELKANSNVGMYIAKLSSIDGSLTIPGSLLFNSNGSINNKSIKWIVDTEPLYITPTYYVLERTNALQFTVATESFYFSNIGVLTIPKTLQASNVKIDDTGLEIVNHISSTSHKFTADGNLLIGNEAFLRTRDGLGGTSGFTITSGTSPNGDTGDVRIKTGRATIGNSGNIEISVGTTNQGAGGSIFINSGTTNIGDAGDIRINTGNSNNDVPGNGGDLLVNLGTGGIGDGGEFRLVAGNTNIGNAGSIEFIAGRTNSGTGGSFKVWAGNSGVGSAGEVSFVAGSGTGVTQAGNVVIQAGINNSNAVYHGHIYLNTANGVWQLDSAGHTHAPGNIDLAGSINAGQSLSIAGSASIGNNLLVNGNLTVIGSTSTVSSVTLTVADKNIELAKVASPTDITADGAGITILGSTNKEFNWYNSSASFTSSENLNLVTAKSYKISNIDVLTSTTLGAGVVNSNLSVLGTVTSGVWQASILSPQYGGTGINNGNRTISIAGNLTTIGSFNTQFTVTDNTSLTLPETGTVATISNPESFTNKTLVSPLITGAPDILGVTATGTTGNGQVVFHDSPVLYTPTFVSPTITGTWDILGVTATGTTGNGQVVFDNSPVLIAPTLGVASVTTLNKLIFTTPATSATLTILDGKTATVENTLTFRGIDGRTVDFWSGGNVAYTGYSLSQFSPTTSLELKTLITDETGSGSLVFADSPSLVTPNLGVANATSINKLVITAPVTSATLTIADGKSITVNNILTLSGADNKTLTVNNSLILSGTDASTVAFGTGGTVAYVANKLNVFATTSSSELASIISDETGSGSLVFANSPTFITPVLGAATATSLNGLTISTSTGILSVANGKTINLNNTLTFTGTDTSSVSFGSGGTVAYVADKLNVFASTTSSELATVISDETGSGSLVFANSPTLITPVLGIATATTINKVAITAPAVAATLTIADGKTLTVNNTLTLTGTDTSSIAFGSGGTVTYRADKLNVFASTTSAELAAVLSDETGSGLIVFNNSPTLITPVLGAATATSVNRVTITQPSTSATITIFDGKTFTSQNTLTIRGTDGSTIDFGGGGNVAYQGGTLSQFQPTTSAQLLSVITDETGTGSLVFANSPTLITPVLGVATATSINNLTITNPGAGTTTFTLASNKTLVVNNSLTFQGTDSSIINFGAGGTIVYSGSNLSVFNPATTTSLQFATIISDETGTGNLVFNNSPTLISPSLITPVLGTATGTSIALTGNISASAYNKVSISAPTNGATFTLSDGKTLTVLNTLNFSGNDSSTVGFTTGGTVAYKENALNQFAATTSLQLENLITDNTGSGNLVFSNYATLNYATLVNPNILTANDFVITGNLSVYGTTTTIQSVLMTSQDPVMTLGGNTAPTTNDNKDRGIEFRWHNGSMAKVGFFGYDTSLGVLTFIPDATNSSEIFSGTLGNININRVLINGNQISASDLSNSVTGTGNVVLRTNAEMITPNIGTPSWGNLVNATGLPVSTGISGLGSGIATFLASTPTSANLASLITDETGTGNLVLNTNAVLITPNIGTPSWGNLVNATGLPVSTGISGLGSGIATFLTTPSSTNLRTTVTDETGTGNLVFNTSPTLGTSIIAGTSSFDLLNTTATTINFGGAATTINIGAANGTTTFAGNLSITGAAYVPNLPAFRVTGTGAQISATANVTGTNMTVDFNQGGYLNTTTGIFTAPLAGIYQVNLVVRTYTNSGVMSQAVIEKNGTVIIMVEWAANTTMNHAGGSTAIKLAVGDSLTFRVLAGSISFDANDNWSVAFLG